MDDIEDEADIGKFDINYDEDESDESETFDDSPPPPDSASLGGPVKDEVVADAVFDTGFDLPGVPSMTQYLHVIKHFRQQDLLRQWFLKSFGNYSFLFAHS
jgi:hypothetical protein